MSGTARGFLLGAITTVGVAALAGIGFVRAGFYPMGADVPHTPATLHLIDTLRDSSTERAARSIKVPADIGDRALIAQGAHEYAEECTGCHLAPGMTSSELRTGLYPQPPNLSEDGIDNDAEAFWIIKHGIKMSAMPAWGRTHDDRTLWSLVAFARQLPKLSPAQYHALVRAPTSADHDAH
jgi:mono/diheme cytochrome c family protein